MSTKVNYGAAFIQADTDIDVCKKLGGIRFKLEQEPEIIKIEPTATGFNVLYKWLSGSDK